MRASIRSGMHERAFRPHWFDTFEWSEYLMQYSTSCTNYVAIQKRRARHDGSRFHGRVWSAPGSLGSMKNLARYASVKCWPFKATKVDEDTSEQSQTANISEIIECREYHRGMQRSGNRTSDNDWKFMDCRQEPNNGGLEIYSPWFHDLCVFICVL